MFPVFLICSLKYVSKFGFVIAIIKGWSDSFSLLTKTGLISIQGTLLPLQLMFLCIELCNDLARSLGNTMEAYLTSKWPPPSPLLFQSAAVVFRTQRLSTTQPSPLTTIGCATTLEKWPTGFQWVWWVTSLELWFSILCQTCEFPSRWNLCFT